jgi:hypothetical protein
MKLISFAVSGRSSYGAVVGDGVVDLGRRLGDRYPTRKWGLPHRRRASVLPDLLHGKETRVWGDQAYHGQRGVPERAPPGIFRAGVDGIAALRTRWEIAPRNFR